MSDSQYLCPFACEAFSFIIIIQVDEIVYRSFHSLAYASYQLLTTNHRQYSTTLPTYFHDDFYQRSFDSLLEIIRHEQQDVQRTTKKFVLIGYNNFKGVLKTNNPVLMVTIVRLVVCQPRISVRHVHSPLLSLRHCVSHAPLPWLHGLCWSQVNYSIVLYGIVALHRQSSLRLRTVHVQRAIL
jgi:hypothetical protein